jgi:hypothetical protein
MHALDQISWSFCTNGPTSHLVKAFPSELIEGGRTGAPPSLGFNNLFLNQLLLWRVLSLAFRILLTTRKCSFNLEICWASKSRTQHVFTIEN